MNVSISGHLQRPILKKKNKVNFILGSGNSYCIKCPKVAEVSIQHPRVLRSCSSEQAHEAAWGGFFRFQGAVDSAASLAISFADCFTLRTLTYS